MNILVCAATQAELDACPQWANANLLVTGVGIPCALASVLASVSRQLPALILNIGIAGAYPHSGLAIGDLVMGSSEVYGDIGFELPSEPGFQSIREASFGQRYQTPLPLSTNWAGPEIPKARGCAVNTCTGTLATGLLRERLFDAAFETMEGAAVAQAGQMRGIPVCQIRAISNIAAERDMQPDNIQLALTRLQEYLHASPHPGHLALPQ